MFQVAQYVRVNRVEALGPPVVHDRMTYVFQLVVLVRQVLEELAIANTALVDEVLVTHDSLAIEIAGPPWSLPRSTVCSGRRIIMTCATPERPCRTECTWRARPSCWNLPGPGAPSRWWP